MELGNIMFGNARGEYEINREKFQPIICNFLSWLQMDYGEVNWKSPYKTFCPNLITDRGGFENEIFKINPYYWGEDEEICQEPNFMYKPTNL